MSERYVVQEMIGDQSISCVRDTNDLAKPVAVCEDRTDAIRICALLNGQDAENARLRAALETVQSIFRCTAPGMQAARLDSWGQITAALRVLDDALSGRGGA